MALYNLQNLRKQELKYLRKVKLYIGTPMYGGMCYAQYVHGMQAIKELCMLFGIKLHTFLMSNESLVQRARNAISHNFLTTDSTHLLFIDADIGFNASDIIQMLLQDVDIIGGNYPKKSIEWAGVKRAMENGVDPKHYGHCSGNHVIIQRYHGRHTVKLDEPYEVRYLGTGFMLIKREVFDKFKETHPEQIYHNNHMTDVPKDCDVCAYFDCKINQTDKHYLSEDYYFCEEMNKLGIPIYMAPWVHLVHTGTYFFDGCLFCTHGDYVHDIKMKPAKETEAK